MFLLTNVLISFTQFITFCRTKYDTVIFNIENAISSAIFVEII